MAGQKFYVNLEAPAGTAALPAHTFYNDPNTGMYSDASDELKFTTGGTLRFTITTTGIASTLPITVAGSTVWHAGNDGAASGLDADLLDAQQGTYYLARANHTGTQAPSTILFSTTDVLLGRDTAAGGAGEEVTMAALRVMLGPTGTPSSTTFLRGDGQWIAPTASVADGDKTDITVSGSGATWTIDSNVVTYAKMQDVAAASRVLGRGSAAGSGDPQELTLGASLIMNGTIIERAALTGDVTATQNSNATTIATGVVTLAKMANLAANSIIGNNTGGALTPIALTTAQVKTMLALSSTDISNFNTAALSATASTYVDVAGDTMTGALLHPNGTAALPSISFSGDPNTGLYSMAADQLGFAVGGVQHMNITTTTLFMQSLDLVVNTGHTTLGGSLVVDNNVEVGGHSELESADVKSQLTIGTNFDVEVMYWMGVAP